MTEIQTIQSANEQEIRIAKTFAAKMIQIKRDLVETKSLTDFNSWEDRNYREIEAIIREVYAELAKLNPADWAKSWLPDTPVNDRLHLAAGRIIGTVPQGKTASGQYPANRTNWINKLEASISVACSVYRVVNVSDGAQWYVDHS